MARFGTFFHFPFSIFLFLSGCSRSTDSTPHEEPSSRERVVVSGPISEDTVWQSGKEYVVTGDVTVEAGATLTIQPDVVVKFAHERADEYYGITVKGTLIADLSACNAQAGGGDSTAAIPAFAATFRFAQALTLPSYFSL